MIDWEQEVDELAARGNMHRALSDDGTLDHLRASGVDPTGFPEWNTDDAADSLAIIEKQIASGTHPAPAIVAMLATHTHIGLLLGLKLAREGKVDT